MEKVLFLKGLRPEEQPTCNLKERLEHFDKAIDLIKSGVRWVVGGDCTSDTIIVLAEYNENNEIDFAIFKEGMWSLKSYYNVTSLSEALIKARAAIAKELSYRRENTYKM